MTLDPAVEQLIRANLYRALPSLRTGNFQITSPDDRYNCVSLVADIKSKRIRHDTGPGNYWPSYLPTNSLVETYILYFKQLNFVRCPDANIEAGFQKIALFTQQKGTEDHFKHVALQHQNGVWKSKLGDFEDIEHPSLDILSSYGTLYGFLKRPWPRPSIMSLPSASS